MKATKKVNVLGTVYTIYDVKAGEDETVDAVFDKLGCDGYTDSSTHEIILKVVDPEPNRPADLEEYRRETLRHELVHAFLNESGLECCSVGVDCWAQNEEMVDWFAIQSPKIFKAFQEAGCL